MRILSSFGFQLSKLEVARKGTLSFESRCFVLIFYCQRRKTMDFIIDMDNDNEFLDFAADHNNTLDGMGSVRRYLRDFENPVEFYSDSQFKERYRLEKITVMHVIIPLLFPNYSLVNNRGLPVPPLIQVAIALRFYATGNYQVNTPFY